MAQYAFLLFSVSVSECLAVKRALSGTPRRVNVGENKVVGPWDKQLQERQNDGGTLTRFTPVSIGTRADRMFGCKQPRQRSQIIITSNYK